MHELLFSTPRKPSRLHEKSCQNPAMEEPRHRESVIDGDRTFCVTGATGYIGSWLVKSLLERGFNIHATVRDLGNVSHLLSLRGSKERLKLFRADLCEEGSFDAAINGCYGVFHVAASMEFNVCGQEDVESYVKSEIIEPSIRGNQNVLAACSRAKSVKRVVFTSSISTISAKDDQGGWKPIVDESCSTPIDTLWKTKPDGWVYVVSKLLTEEAAFRFAKEKGIDIVSILPVTVAGPLLTSTIPASIRVLLSLITGDLEFYPILTAVHSRLGSVSLVHIEDICNAHIFLMEHPASKGRYVCSAHSCSISQLADFFSREYSFTIQRFPDEFNGSIPSTISSKKLTDLGFSFTYGLGEIIKESVSCCSKHGFLKTPQSQV